MARRKDDRRIPPFPAEFFQGGTLGTATGPFGIDSFRVHPRTGMLRPFAKIKLRNGIARYLPGDGPEFKLQLVFGKSTLKRNAFKDSE